MVESYVLILEEVPNIYIELNFAMFVERGSLGNLNQKLYEHTKLHKTFAPTAAVSSETASIKRIRS